MPSFGGVYFLLRYLPFFCLLTYWELTMNKLFKLAVAVAILLPTSAFADLLPESAVKLKSSEAKALYSGKSIKWDNATGYFAPDGTFYGVSKKDDGIGEGTWSVRGNRVCYKAKWTGLKSGKSRNVSHCWTHYKDGRTYWTLWSGSKGKKDHYYDDEVKKLKRGDKVTRKYKKLVKKYR